MTPAHCRVFTRAAIVAVFAVAMPAQKPAAESDTIDFERDVAPILQARCISCHGAEEQEADLRLDTKAGLFPTDEDLWTVIPGKPAESIVLERIELPADDPDVMPAEGDPLEKAQIATIRKWIEAGAQWPEGYTIAALERERLPEEVPLLGEIPETQLAIGAQAVERVGARGGLAMPVSAKSPAIEVNLSLVGKKASDEWLADLEGLEPQLVWLNLSNTSVSSSGVERLTKYTELRRVHLARTQVGDTAAAALAKLPNLEYLNLYGSKLTDKGLDALAAAPKLAKLYVWQTAVTPGAIARLREQKPGLAIDNGQGASALLDFIAKRKEEAAKKAAAKKADEAKKKAGAKKKTAKADAKKSAAKPVNDKCPVSGQPIDAAVTAEHAGQTVAFCCTKCRAKFVADPKQFASKLPAPAAAKKNAKAAPAKPAAKPVNDKCPVSGQPIDAAVTAEHAGQTVAFCCTKCRAKFIADPKQFASKLPAPAAAKKNAKAAPAKPAGKKTAKAKPRRPKTAMNVNCPVSGQGVDVAVVAQVDGRSVAFCCAKCRAKFLANPAAYADKLDRCP